MKFSKTFTRTCSLTLALLMSNFAGATSVANGRMISTQTFLTQTERNQAQSDVENYLQRADVQRALVDRGEVYRFFEMEG